MLQIVLILGSLIAALLMGAAVLGAVSGERKWRGFARPDSAGARAIDTSAAAFEPLQMEPFTLTWPSEVERPTTSIPEPPWPSETWDDEYFGVRSRADVQRVRDASIRAEEQRDRAYRAESMRQQDHEKKRRQERSDERTQQAARPAKAKKRKQQHAPKPAEQRVVEEQFFGSASGANPTPQEIAALVRQHGLAGAVEQIRARTGWDFREAAQYLAQVLRDQK